MAHRDRAALLLRRVWLGFHVAIVLVPTFSDAFYTQATSLDGRVYVLEFRYNQREKTWYLTVSLTDGARLVSGVKVVCSRPLLRRFADHRLPEGDLMAVSNTEDTSPPGLEELGIGKRVTLTYREARA